MLSRRTFIAVVSFCLAFIAMQVIFMCNIPDYSIFDVSRETLSKKDSSSALAAEHQELKSPPDFQPLTDPCTPTDPTFPVFTQLYPIHNREYFFPGAWDINGTLYPVGSDPVQDLADAIQAEFGTTIFLTFGQADPAPGGFFPNFTLFLETNPFGEPAPDYSTIRYKETEPGGGTAEIQCVIREKLITTTDISRPDTIIQHLPSVDNITAFGQDSQTLAMLYDTIIHNCLQGTRIQYHEPIDSTQKAELETLGWTMQDLQ